MKIGLNARFLLHPYTGIGQYTRFLVESLAKLNRQNEYFLFTPELIEWNLPDHVHQIRVLEQYASKSFAKTHWEHTLLPQEFVKWKIDLAHFLYPSNPWRRLKVPTLVTVHDVIPWRLKAYRSSWRSKLYHFYAGRALRRADHLITVSEFSKREIMEVFKIKEKNIAVIPHGVPFNSTWSKSFELDIPSLPLRRNFLLYVGGYDERKNVPLLIQAYLKHIANRFPIDLILVGGKNRGFERLITDEYAQRVTPAILVQPKGDIIFTNPLAPNELTALYKQALMLVHPSLYEGFNLPLLEAMHSGLPIVCSDIPANREVTRNQALFFDPHSPDALGETIKILLNKKSLAEDFARKGRQNALEYTWEKSAEMTLGVYNLFI